MTSRPSLGAKVDKSGRTEARMPGGEGLFCGRNQSNKVDKQGGGVIGNYKHCRAGLPSVLTLTRNRRVV